MNKCRNLLLLLAGLALVGVCLGCGVEPIQESIAPPEEAPTKEPEPAAPPTSLSPLIGELPTPTPAILIPVTGGRDPEPQPAVPESRRLTLEYPPTIRLGDSGVIRFQLEVDDLGGVTPTAEMEGNVVTGETVEFPNLYNTHNVVAEARLDLAGMQVSPPGTISEPLLPGQSATFYWSVRPADTGTYRGTVWFHLRFIPKGQGEESRIPVSVQFIEIETAALFGLSGGAARSIGAFGSLVGSVLGFPFVTDILKWFWKWRRKKAA